MLRDEDDCHSDAALWNESVRRALILANTQERTSDDTGSGDISDFSGSNDDLGLYDEGSLLDERGAASVEAEDDASSDESHEDGEMIIDDASDFDL